MIQFLKNVLAIAVAYMLYNIITPDIWLALAPYAEAAGVPYLGYLVMVQLTGCAVMAGAVMAVQKKG